MNPTKHWTYRDESATAWPFRHAAGALSDLPGLHSRHDEPADFRRGWLRKASHACDERTLETHLADLSPASRAQLLSQAGPHVARAFTVLPTSDDVAIPDAHFRVLLLRRLCMPFPLWPCSCSCRGELDAYGDHRAACSTSGVLASRALPLERAIARVCQKAGARVGRNVALAAMNIDVPVHDARRIEVVCNGLPLWHGAQLAVDATLVSPVTRDGRPHDGVTTRVVPSAMPRDANAGKRTPRLTAAAAVAWSCLVSRLEDVGLRSSPLEWPHLRSGAACARCHFPGAPPPVGAWCCWPAASSARAPCRCSLAGGS